MNSATTKKETPLHTKLDILNILNHKVWSIATGDKKKEFYNFFGKEIKS